MAATISTLRTRVHATQPYSDDSRGSSHRRAFRILVLGSALLAVAVSSVSRLPDTVEQLLAFVIALVAAVEEDEHRRHLGNETGLVATDGTA